MWNEKYNNEQFVYGTAPNDFLRDNAHRFSPEGKILCIAEGEGRNAVWLAEQGFQVTAVDGSEELAKFASELIGQEVIVSDFKDLVLPTASFDAIWASASLLHVHSEALPGILAKVIDLAKPGAIFYMSFKYGDYEGERGGRYYTDLNEARFADLMQKSGRSLEIIEQWVAKDVRPDKPELWLNTFARK